MVHYVIIGGGVAGVCCAEELCSLCPNDTITLISIDRVLKGVSTVAKITQTIEEIQLVEKDFSGIPYKNFKWIQGIVTSIHPQTKTLSIHNINSNSETTTTNDNNTSSSIISYDKVCICTGAHPKRLLNSPYVHVIRDTESVQSLSSKLQKSKKVVVVGNGGIALELAYNLKNIEIVWIVKHKHIGDAFFDADAAQFLLEELMMSSNSSNSNNNNNKDSDDDDNTTSNKNELLSISSVARHHGGNDSNGDATSAVRIKKKDGSSIPLGHAVGPRWASDLTINNKNITTTNSNTNTANTNSNLHIEYECDVVSITQNNNSTSPHSLYEYSVQLSDGRYIQADLIISAIGVDPGASLQWVPPSIQRGKESALLVNNRMETSAPDIYAAGDACCARWAEEHSPHWFQMRLWSQARSMAIYAAHCMSGINDQRGADMAFEVFTHVTRFLGKKVVFLGLYNGQRLEHEPEADVVSYSRVMELPAPEGRTFVRILLVRGRVQGAVMIGETDLEETVENLIMDGLDVSRYGAELLDPDVELDHVFD